MNYVKMKLTAVMSMLHTRNWTNPQIGKTIGVSTLQAHYYHIGKTLQPSAKVCKAIYDNIEVEGKQVLIDLYSTPEELIQHFNISMK